MENYIPPPHLQLTETLATHEINENLLTGVITAAVMAEGPKPGIWQKMIQAINRGAGRTKEGTVNAFLFQAMVDRLLAEFHAPDNERLSE